MPVAFLPALSSLFLMAATVIQPPAQTPEEPSFKCIRNLQGVIFASDGKPVALFYAAPLFCVGTPPLALNIT